MEGLEKESREPRVCHAAAADVELLSLGFQSLIVVFMFLKRLFQWQEENNIFKFSSVSQSNKGAVLSTFLYWSF